MTHDEPDSPAKRVVRLASACLTQANGNAAVDTWCRLLQVPMEDPRRSYRVAQLLADASLEVDEFERALVAARVAPATYAEELQSVRAAFSINFLATGWDQTVRASLTAHHVKVLAAFAETLPSQSCRASEDELQDTQKALGALRATVIEDASLPKDVVDYLLLLIARMEEAILEYRIIGERALARLTERAILDHGHRAPFPTNMAERPTVKEADTLLVRMSTWSKHASPVVSIVRALWSGTVLFLSVAHGMGVIESDALGKFLPLIRGGSERRLKSGEPGEPGDEPAAGGDPPPDPPAGAA